MLRNGLVGLMVRGLRRGWRLLQAELLGRRELTSQHGRLQNHNAPRDTEGGSVILRSECTKAGPDKMDILDEFIIAV